MIELGIPSLCQRIAMHLHTLILLKFELPQQLVVAVRAVKSLELPLDFN